jgi:hypothetical protein
VRHAELVLRVIGARVGRVERQELAVLVDREHVAFERSLAQKRIGETQLRVGAISTLRIAVHQLPEILARREPVLLVELLGAALPQEPVGVQDADGRPLRPRGAAGRREN